MYFYQEEEDKFDIDKLISELENASYSDGDDDDDDDDLDFMPPMFHHKMKEEKEQMYACNIFLLSFLGMFFVSLFLVFTFRKTDDFPLAIYTNFIASVLSYLGFIPLIFARLFKLTNVSMSDAPSEGLSKLILRDEIITTLNLIVAGTYIGSYPGYVMSSIAFPCSDVELMHLISQISVFLNMSLLLLLYCFRPTSNTCQDRKLLLTNTSIIISTLFYPLMILLV